MNINELTIGQLKELRCVLGINPGGDSCADDSHWVVGENYFIRTVTFHLLGRLVKVTPSELVLTEAAWIADDGRFNEAMANGTVKECEPYPKDALVIVGRGSLIDATKWKHALLSVVK